MAQPTQAQNARLARLADKILIAWRNGEARSLQRELERARLLAEKARPASTLEMETLEVLSGAAESLGKRGGKHAGAVRLLEHIAQRSEYPGAFWPKAC